MQMLSSHPPLYNRKQTADSASRPTSGAGDDDEQFDSSPIGPRPILAYNDRHEGRSISAITHLVRSLLCCPVSNHPSRFYPVPLLS